MLGSNGTTWHWRFKQFAAPLLIKAWQALVDLWIFLRADPQATGAGADWIAFCRRHETETSLIGIGPGKEFVLQ